MTSSNIATVSVFNFVTIWYKLLQEYLINPVLIFLFIIVYDTKSFVLISRQFSNLSNMEVHIIEFLNNAFFHAFRIVLLIQVSGLGRRTHTTIYFHGKRIALIYYEAALCAARFSNALYQTWNYTKRITAYHHLWYPTIISSFQTW